MLFSYYLLTVNGGLFLSCTKKVMSCVGFPTHALLNNISVYM